MHGALQHVGAGAAKRKCAHEQRECEKRDIETVEAEMHLLPRISPTASAAGMVSPMVASAAPAVADTFTARCNWLASAAWKAIK